MDVLSKLMENKNAEKKTKEDKFCEFLAMQLKEFKCDETFEDITMDILKLLRNAKKKEKDIEENLLATSGSENWGNLPFRSSTPDPLNIDSSRESSPFQNINRSSKKIHVQEIVVFKPEKKGTIPIRKPDILQQAACDLFQDNGLNEY